MGRAAAGTLGVGNEAPLFWARDCAVVNSRFSVVAISSTLSQDDVQRRAIACWRSEEGYRNARCGVHHRDEPLEG